MSPAEKLERFEQAAVAFAMACTMNAGDEKKILRTQRTYEARKQEMLSLLGRS
jgi:hypothetical protein